ncbi:hypothetical protein E8E11_003531 [Didymella keratinophila]|nr:hypothetical protein E8E11_003531 [Didymella keratinophila]
MAVQKASGTSEWSNYVPWKWTKAEFGTWVICKSLSFGVQFILYLATYKTTRMRHAAWEHVWAFLYYISVGLYTTYIAEPHRREMQRPRRQDIERQENIERQEAIEMWPWRDYAMYM